MMLPYLPLDGCQAITEAIIRGEGLAVSDGSYDPDIYTSVGTSGFVLAASKEENEDRLKGMNWVPDTATDQSAYRNELCLGLLEFLRLLKLL